MLRRSHQLLALLVTLVPFLDVLVPALAASTSTSIRRGPESRQAAYALPLSARVFTQRRWLSLLSGRSRHDTDDDTANASDASGGNEKAEAAASSPYGTGEGGGGGGVPKAAASESAAMTGPATPTKPKSEDKPTANATLTASEADSGAGNATSASNSTRKSTPSSTSANSQDAMDDASGMQDDDSASSSSVHFSQWDVTNATDFDGMLKNQTYRGPGLLPPDDAEPPPHWDVAMTALFAVLAVLLCLGTAVRRYRNQRQQQRASYEPIHNITV